MKFDRETMRRRFHEAQKEKAELEAQIAPLQERRDQLAAEMQAVKRDLDVANAQLKEARQPIYELQTEVGGIAKFLADADGKARLGTPD